MDDTKKLIEKYKRELMELSKQRKKPEVIGYVDGDETILSDIKAGLSPGFSTRSPLKSAKNSPENSEAPAGHAGAVSGGISTRDPLESMDDKFANSKAPMNENDDHTEGISTDSRLESEENGFWNFTDTSADEDRSPGDIRSDPGEKNSSKSAEDPSMRPDLNGSGNITEIIDEYAPERPPKCNSEDPEGFGDPDVIFERNGSGNSAQVPEKKSSKSAGDPSIRPDLNGSGNITEIIDEYAPERPAKCNSEDPEGFGAPDVIFERNGSENSSNPNRNSAQNSEKNSSKNAGNSSMRPGLNGSGNTSNPNRNSAQDPGKNSSKSTGNSSMRPDLNSSGNTSNPNRNPAQDPEKNSSKNAGNSSTKPDSAAPNYTTISSTADVRAGITENSQSKNNEVEPFVSGITSTSRPFPGADSAEAIRTSEAQAERLGLQPVSGTSPDEQLTGRSFEGTDRQSENPPGNIEMIRGSRAEPIDYPEKNFTNFEEFERVNTGRGSLMFRVYTGREAVVIEGAECVITKKIGSETRVIATLQTNNSGQTPVQQLPAPPRELSQNSENAIQPFALYDAEVTKPGFVRVILKDIPVFDGVESVQKVFMIVE